MNLDGCTPEQRQSIQQVQGPLLISAGAGSGKTFTLTQRIAYALSPESGPALDSIDEVLAITFTDRAAAEIKARIKHTLRAEGLYDQALKVDEAWVSTIHSMCGRILRAHAFDLGIDPGFSIMSDYDRADMITQAINDVLGEDNDIVDRDSFVALFNEYPARPKGRNGTSVASLVETLMNKAVGLRGGLDSIDFGPSPVSATSLARDLLLAYEDASVALEQAGQSKTAENNRTNTAQAIEALNKYLLEYGAQNTGDTKSEDTAIRALACVKDDCAHLNANMNNKVKPAIKECQRVYDRVAQEIALALAYPLTDELMCLAHQVSERYAQLKQAVCKLDHDDMLIKTLEAFENHPDIAARYSNRFKLVMVDEFQDTSQLQVDLISFLAGDNLSRLCTVGDAQQSIYRFRGADVNVYEAHKRTMRGPEVNACSVELTKNFRSHPDILSFVDRIFAQPEVFGQTFMSLEPHVERPSIYKGQAPRINLVLATKPTEADSSVAKIDLQQACAQAIAQQFAALVQQGHDPNDMVILVGKMTKAGLYADALRSEGLECVVTGGSQFSSACEVRVVSRFLEALANPANTQALFEVFASDMIRLSADDLLRLSTTVDPKTGEEKRCNLKCGLANLMDSPVDELSPRLAFAVEIFKQAQHELRTHPAADVVRNAVIRSGWMSRLEQGGADGLAQAANILKALRLIEDIESQGVVGLASIARIFAAQLSEGMKEKPGALSGEQGNAVRIMTIHSSKGLEFPIVALADFDGATSSSSKLIVQACGPVARASLMPQLSLESYENVKKYYSCLKAENLEGDPDFEAARRLVNDDESTATQPDAGYACTAASYGIALKQRSAKEELAEARRKLYVGLTRASEALIVTMIDKKRTNQKSSSYDPLTNDIRLALVGDGDFPADDALLDYGGTEPARFQRIIATSCVSVDDERANKAQEDQIPQQFFVPTVDPINAFHVPWNVQHQDTFSYTSISPHFSAPVSQNVSEPERSVSAPQKVSESEQTLPVSSTHVGEPLGDDASSAENPETSTFASDSDKATDLGSAFHRSAQYAIETDERPDASRLATYARTFNLSNAATDRLFAAADRWFTSPTWEEIHTWSSRHSEVPFFVQIGDAFLEGDIDLLCTNPVDESSEPHALVIDYKTGGTPDESADNLQDKHRLQAQCYALALLLQGYPSVELRFVRVEQDDGAGNPQEVRYSFIAEDREQLECEILDARSKVC